ncbi:translocation/assembly module TamB domain-containing protein [Celerinatantimonas sp. YJH-8]|uniref:translocation/assembly module TamB domain-containing protein n=1 Tax=Celerinatantimonas sp. YJH-8 TaxID=3228714 RepID=UPI0038C3329D
MTYWRRAGFALGLGILGVVIAVTALLASPRFNAWAINRLLQDLPELQIRGLHGTLWSGFSAEQMRYQKSGLFVFAQNPQITLDSTCLLARKICIHDIRADQLRVMIQSSALAASSPQSSATDSELELGRWSVAVDRLRIRQAQFEVDQQQWGWQKLTIDYAFGHSDRIQLGTVQLDDWYYRAAGPVTSISSPMAVPHQLVSALTSQLAVFKFPYSITVQRFMAHDGQTSIWPTPISLIRFRGQFTPEQWMISDLQFHSPEGSVAGQLQLALASPFLANLKLQITAPWRGMTHQLDVAATGPAKQLDVQAAYRGMGDAKLTGQLNWDDPTLPFSLQLKGKLLSGEPESIGDLQGQLQLTGSLRGYQGTLQASLQAKQVLQLTGTLQGDWQQQQNVRLKLATGTGQLEVMGHGNWQSLSAQLQLQAKHLDLNPWSPVSLPVISDGTVDIGVQGHQWQLSDGRIHGRWQKQRYAVELDAAGLNWKQVQQLKMHGTLGKNQVHLEGAIGEKVHLTGTFNLSHLDQLWPGLSGKIAGHMVLEGPFQALLLSWQSQGQQLAYAPAAIQFKQFVGQGHIRLDERLSGDSTLTLQQFQYGRYPAVDMKATYHSAGQQSLNFQAIQDHRQLRMRIAGLGNRFKWQGQLEALSVTDSEVQWSLQHPTGMAWEQQQFKIEPLCLHDISHQGQFCLTEPSLFSADSIQFEGQIQSLTVPVFVQPWWQHLQWSAALSGLFHLHWQRGSVPDAKVTLHSTSGTLLIPKLGQKPVRYTYQNAQLQLVSTSQQLHVAAVFDSQQLGSARADLSTNMTADRRYPLTGTVSLKHFQLASLAPFFDTVSELNGRLQGELQIRGYSDAPQLSGQILLEEGHLSGPSIPLVMDHLRCDIQVSGQQAQIQGQFDTQGHPAHWHGQVGWSQGAFKGRLMFSGEQLPVHYPPAELVVSPKLTVQLDPQQIDISGHIQINKGLIKIAQLPQSAISLSDDVVILDQPQSQRQNHALAMNMTVDLGNALYLDAEGLTAQLTGQLNLHQQPEQDLFAMGQVSLEDGRFKAYGQDLQIQSGTLTFSGPLNEPNISVKAIRDPDNTDDNVTVGVTASGPPHALVVNIFSDPQMAQNEQLSYLLRGHGITSQEDNSALTSLLLSTGVSQTGAIVTRLGEKVGIDQLQLSTAGSGDATQVRVSGYLLPGVRVQYGMGVFATNNELTVRYQLIPKFYLEVVSGLANALNFYYEFSIQ